MLIFPFTQDLFKGNISNIHLTLKIVLGFVKIHCRTLSWETNDFFQIAEMNKSWHFRRVLQKSYLKNHEKFLLKASCQSPIACRVRWNFIWEMPPPKTASLVFPELLGHVMAKTRPINKDTNKLFFQRNQQLICSLP